MADVLTREQRRRCMAAIGGKDTKPELLVRRLAHAMGYRYRLHRKDLPGKPDLVFPSRRMVIFVHGCFWHQHQGCSFATRPATRADFWAEKLDGNRARDKRVCRELTRLGWRSLVIWECQAGDPDWLHDRLVSFLDPE